tara:strand:+ start:274 stop:507 length:234 start_codon:yes stop_codon:yes gene_type:complete
MNKSIEIFIIFLTLLYLVSFLYRDVDELGMDSYDKYLGIAGDGDYRGITGIIYKRDGSINLWKTLTDKNPVWNYQWI